MIAAAARRRGPWQASSRAIGIALAATAALTVVALRGADGGTWASASPEAVAAYEAEIEQLGRDGGIVVAQGMRPGVADIAQSALPDDVLVVMATGWRDAMEELRREAALLAAPGALGEVAAGFDAAFGEYVRTATVLLAAARSSGDLRAHLVDRAVGLGQAADDRYDRAMAMLARLTDGEQGR